MYGDYCSGEIFMWDGITQTVLVDTSSNISSFGEDEAGELYVVGLGDLANTGTVSKFVIAETATVDSRQPTVDSE
jgi:hypothetical protein